MNARAGLRRLFDVRPGEGAFVFVLWLAYLVVVLGLRVGWGATTALFLKVVGVRWLPAVLMIRALASLVATGLYAAWADRARNDRIFLVILGSGAALLAAATLLSTAAPIVCAIALFVVARAVSTVFFLHWGVYLSEFFQPADAKRLYPGIFSGARVGGLLGGALLATLPDVLGTDGLVLVFAASLLVGGAVVHASAGPRFDRFRNTPSGPPPAAVEAAARAATARRGARGGWPGFRNLWDGVRYVRGSRFLLWTAACTVLLVVTRNILLVANNTVFEAAYPDTASLTEFFGWYALIAGAVALLLQVGAAGRVIARFGIARPNLGYSVALAASALGLTIAPYLPAAIATRFAENELRTSLKIPVHNLLYNAVEPRVRARARATSSGLVIPVAALTINGLLLVLQPALPVWALAGLAAATGAAYVWATRRQNREFVRTLAARAASEALGDEALPPTPTPVPRADVDAAVRRLCDPGAARGDRLQAVLEAPAQRIDRARRDVVARALADELDVAARLLAFAHGRSERDRARVLERAADVRCRYGLALTGAWVESRISHAVLVGATEPVRDVAEKVGPMKEVLAELVSPRMADALAAAAERYVEARRGRLAQATLPVEAAAVAGAWNDPWLAAGLLLALEGAGPALPEDAAAIRAAARESAAKGGLLDPPPGAAGDADSWRGMAVLDRVALFLRYPAFRDLSLPELEGLARAPTGAAIGAELLGEEGRPVAAPDDALLRRHLADWSLEDEDD